MRACVRAISAVHVGSSQAPGSPDTNNRLHTAERGLLLLQGELSCARPLILHLLKHTHTHEVAHCCVAGCAQTIPGEREREKEGVRRTSLSFI